MGKESKSKKKQSSRSKAPRADEEDIPIDTKRFDSSKPQFKETNEKSGTKVVLDERFSSVLTDPKFQLDIQDKYGRKNKKDKAKSELSAFYEIEDPAASNDDGDDRKTPQEEDHSPAIAEQKTNNDDDESSSEEEGVHGKLQNPASRIAYLTALSRGELDLSSSSDESDGDDDDDNSHSEDDGDSEATDDVMGKAGILDPSKRDEEIEITTEESPYLAVMDMDWSHVRALDIFAVVSSFVPPGSVKSVRVYASDFGIARMEREAQFGPEGLWKKSESTKNNSGAPDSGSSDEEREKTSVGDDAEEALSSGFDPEKLREYEASKLKYYFAVVEMASSSHAESVYKEIDGLEFEHSSAALDVRAIPEEELPNIVKERPMRDEATGIPSNYEPPEFVVSALQQTNVQCTWEAGDRERERTLTKYAESGQDWREIAESDDIKAYLGSDASSDEDEEKGQNKTSRMRKMLGLDNSGDEDSKGNSDEDKSDSEDDSSNGGEYARSESFLIQEEEDEAGGDKVISFVPGAEKLEDKIRSTIDKKKDAAKEATPWEAFLEKRKQKRKERKAMARAKREEINQSRRVSKEDKSNKKNPAGSAKSEKEKSKKWDAELELLVAGDDGEEEQRDYDIRGLQRLEQNKSKKLKGARKRKEAARETNLMGTGFKVDMEDNRFGAVLDGMDDRFGIDRTDPNYKETPAMREIMAEQTRRRKKRKTKFAEAVVPNISAESNESNSGASALSSLVSRLKQKVSK